jgi:hypothetical protein
MAGLHFTYKHDKLACIKETARSENGERDGGRNALSMAHQQRLRDGEGPGRSDVLSIVHERTEDREHEGKADVFSIAHQPRIGDGDGDRH